MKSLNLPIKVPSNAKPFRLVWISPGTFRMGIDKKDYGYREIAKGYFDFKLPNAFECTITRGYWLSVYHITEFHWNALFEMPYPGSNLPKTNVSWYEAIQFCKRLSNASAGTIPKNSIVSLPTEAQWEFAARAGSQSIYHHGNKEGDLIKTAWTAENSYGHLHEVGVLPANSWGLYDMPGNVAEWCFDRPIEFPKRPTTDWLPSEEDFTSAADLRIFRGNKYTSNASDPSWRSGFRMVANATLRSPFIGFRVAIQTGNQTHS